MYLLREKNGIFPVYKMIDTCASEFSSYLPYFYSTYEDENESQVSDKEKIVARSCKSPFIGCLYGYGEKGELNGADYYAEHIAVSYTHLTCQCR